MNTNDRNLTNGDDEPRVHPGQECPQCRENRMDYLVWIDDEHVGCATCGTVYEPGRSRE